MSTSTTTTTQRWVPLDDEARESYEKYYSQKDRGKMDPDDFAGPHRSFPIMSQADVDNAARLIGHADDPEAVKRKIIAIAKRKGFKIPDAWQKEPVAAASGAKESAAQAGAAAAFAPKARVARIKVCWIEFDAMSLNGRQYPRETVEKLVRNAQTDLADPNALPITCYISHREADEDDTRELVGRVTEVWMEGTKGYAWIDIPDTEAGRDVASLSAYGYIKTISLRASGVAQKLDRGRSVPQVVEVVGERATLNGIDFTTNPGLAKVAHIDQVMLEAAKRAGLAEDFDLPGGSILIMERGAMTKQATATKAGQQATPAGAEAQGNQLTEAGLADLVSGITSGTDGDQTADGYQQKMMSLPPRNQDQLGTTGRPMTPELESALGEAHDRIAMVQGRSCAPSAESAYGQRILQEAGRSLSGKNDSHLDVAHDHLAHALGKDCEGARSKAAAPVPLVPDNDNDMESAATRTAATLKETKTMTPQEAARILEAAGYEVKAPKTKAELLEEKLAAQAQQIEELKKLVEGRTAGANSANQAQGQGAQQGQPAPQRRSLVEGANVGVDTLPPWMRQTPAQAASVQGQTGQPVVRYRNGDYLTERFAEIDWARLADRSYPIPDFVNPEWLVNELAQTACAMLEEKYQAF